MIDIMLSGVRCTLLVVLVLCENVLGMSSLACVMQWLVSGEKGISRQNGIQLLRIRICAGQRN